MAAQLGPRFRVLGSRAAYVKHGMDVQEERLRAGVSPDSPGFGAENEEMWGLLGTEDAKAAVPTEHGAYLDFYRGVESCLRAGTPPPVSPESVIDALAVLEAARLSAAERVVVQPCEDT
jgi:predicted dehydrogenase